MAKAILITGMLFGAVALPTLADAQNSTSTNTTCTQTDLTIQKSGQTTVTRGGRIVYTITVTNVSSCDAEQVVVNDTIPNGTQFITSEGASCTQNTATNVACTLGTIHGGQSRTFTLTFQTVNDIACNTTVQNTAVVSTVTQESNTGNNTSQTVPTMVQCPVQPNSGCIEIIKTAIDSHNAVLSTVPPFTFTLDSNRTTVYDSTGRTRFDNVSVGTHVVIESVPQGWTLESVNPGNGTVHVSQGSSCAQVHFTNRQQSTSTPNFSISKTDGESEVEPGDELEYVITVRNNSSQTVHNVTVTDNLPHDVDFESCSDNCSRNGRTITWNNLTFAPNEEKRLRLEVEVDEDADDDIVNHAYVFNLTATDRTDVEEEDSDDDDDDIGADLRKEASTAEAFPGTIIEYTVTLRNTGDGDIRNITVTDTLPFGMTFVDVAGGQRSGNTIRWTIDRLRENETWTKRYRATADAGLMPGTVLRNNVRAHGGGIDESAATTVSVIGAAQLPQTGFDGGQTSLKLNSINSNDSSASLAALLSMIGIGTGAGIGFGRKYFFDL